MQKWLILLFLDITLKGCVNPILVSGLIECYIISNRNKEALAVAKSAHKSLGTNARTWFVSVEIL